MNVYEVESAIQTQDKKEGDKKWGKKEWSRAEPLHVLTNGDAIDAAEKARAHILRQKPEAFDGDDGKMVQRTVDVRVTKAEYICTLDVQ